MPMSGRWCPGFNQLHIPHNLISWHNVIGGCFVVFSRRVRMFPHHVKLDVCEERAKYRQGRKLTAVKVSGLYTVGLCLCDQVLECKTYHCVQKTWIGPIYNLVLAYFLPKLQHQQFNYVISDTPPMRICMDVHVCIK